MVQCKQTMNSKTKVPVCKRTFDVIFSVLVLVLLSPLLLVISIALLLSQGRPVLFLQERPGLQGKLFRIYKFRTMRNQLDRCGQPLPDAARITCLGAFLRRTSLDELPEFLNVLAGQMSVVGPRPLLVQYLECYSPEQARRHEVLPGVTGWAQVNGRNALSWDEKFRLDIWYVEHWSFWLDLRIILNTICKVFSGEGISQLGHASMPEFMGNEPDER